jgi:death-on-curing protein
VIYLTLEELLHVAERTLGTVELRDVGLLEAAAARPRASAFGKEAYPTLHDKAAALLHSLARNHPLVDGNKRLALAATIAFYGVNGVGLTLTNDEAYKLVMAVAAGRADDIPAIAERLARGAAARGSQVATTSETHGRSSATKAGSIACCIGDSR